MKADLICKNAKRFAFLHALPTERHCYSETGTPNNQGTIKLSRPSQLVCSTGRVRGSIRPTSSRVSFALPKLQGPQVITRLSIKIGATAPAVWQHMIKLKPKTLKRSMLPGIFLSPRQGLPIKAPYGIADFSPYDRDAAEPAPIAVTADYCPSLFRIRFLFWVTPVSLQYWWRSFNCPHTMNLDARRSPKRLNPVAHFRHVGISYQACGPAVFTCEMRIDGPVKQFGHLKDLRDRFTKARSRCPKIRVRG